jgi:hypothetical protein
VAPDSNLSPDIGCREIFLDVFQCPQENSGLLPKIAMIASSLLTDYPIM